jgi:CspA family cold shock protein
VIWLSQTSRKALRLYYGLLLLGVVLAVAAIAVADDLATAFLAGAVTAALVAHVWRIIATRGIFSGPIIGEEDDVEMGVSEPLISARPADEVKTVERGRVESWDEEAGWGVLSADLPEGGVFAHFSAVAGEGYRNLKPGAAVSFDYVTAAGGPGSQDGCSYVAERVVQLDDSA